MDNFELIVCEVLLNKAHDTISGNLFIVFGLKKGINSLQPLLIEKIEPFPIAIDFHFKGEFFFVAENGSVVLFGQFNIADVVAGLT